VPAKGARDVKVYEIRLQGRLDQHWATWFEEMTLTYDADNTVLRGPLADEAALHGVLDKIRDMNVHLLSVQVILERDSPAPAPTATEATKAGVTDDPASQADGSPQDPDAARAASAAKRARTSLRKRSRKRPRNDGSETRGGGR
jgi:hypothetical protein